MSGEARPIPRAQGYPRREVYERLYEKWLGGEKHLRMLERVRPEDKRLLDLSGGGGRIALEALRQGAREVLWMDLSEEMGADLGARAGEELAARLRKRVGPLSQTLPRLEFAAWDAAVCQQAVNYWLTGPEAGALARALRPGGLFVFNTFWRKPSSEIVERAYRIGEASFVERHRLAPDGWVEHEQIREGEGSHATRFRWIPPEAFRRMLGPWFECAEEREGASALWVCRRK